MKGMNKNPTITSVKVRMEQETVTEDDLVMLHADTMFESIEPVAEADRYGIYNVRMLVAA